MSWAGIKHVIDHQEIIIISLEYHPSPSHNTHSTPHTSQPDTIQTMITHPATRIREGKTNCKNCKVETPFPPSLSREQIQFFNLLLFKSSEKFYLSCWHNNTFTNRKIRFSSEGNFPLDTEINIKLKSTMTTVSGMEALELTVAGRPSKIWTSKLRHIKRKTRTNLHKTKTICQQLI